MQRLEYAPTDRPSIHSSSSYRVTRRKGRLVQALPSDAPKRWILDAATRIAETGHGTDVRPTGELLLHRLRQCGSIHVRVGGSLGRELSVEVGRIKRVDLADEKYQLPGGFNEESSMPWATGEPYDVGFKGRLISSLQKLPPVDAMEELMSLDLRRTTCAQAPGGIAIQQASEEILGGRRHDLRTGEVKMLRQDLAIHLVGVLVVEWW